LQGQVILNGRKDLLDRGHVCESACKFDPLKLGIGFQN
jgi:hypothetical protein